MRLVYVRMTACLYAMRQVDTDGTASYSPVRTVAVAAGPAVLALFPNPTDHVTTLTGARPGTAVTVFDAVWHKRTVYSSRVQGGGLRDALATL
jgi:hypothetical protein